MNTSITVVLQLKARINRGGQWLCSAREWIKNHVPRGDSLCWGDRTPVSVQFAELEHLARAAADGQALADYHLTQEILRRLLVSETRLLPGEIDHVVACFGERFASGQVNGGRHNAPANVAEDSRI